MKRRPLVFYILIYFIVFIAALAVMAVMVFNRINTLSGETAKIAAMDLNNDSVDLSLKLNGKYGIVERTIKEYVNEYAKGIQKLSDMPVDTTIVELLGTQNILNDAPEFTKSRAYLDEKRTELHELAEKLETMGKQESIDSAFDRTGLNFFMKRVYNNQMYRNLTLDFFYPSREIDKAVETIEGIFDGKEEVLDFLTENQEHWHFDGEMIEFENEELLAQYQSVIEGK